MSQPRARVRPGHTQGAGAAQPLGGPAYTVVNDCNAAGSHLAVCCSGALIRCKDRERDAVDRKGGLRGLGAQAEVMCGGWGHGA